MSRPTMRTPLMLGTPIGARYSPQVLQMTFDLYTQYYHFFIRSDPQHFSYSCLLSERLDESWSVCAWVRVTSPEYSDWALERSGLHCCLGGWE
ncbi:hypothetical protein NDU88_005867 [Pleurodeles waltl]|uniref:Uncharacterized protein n=1 Tax=Pleurodeles waltl TaxID=8319 RepID=A0AAV7UL70_PLEWA|nr:hypothetical protein NDU88_005867 [Pleurodeles waltl]